MLKQYFPRHGIIHEMTTLYAQEKWIVERKYRTLKEMLNTMLIS